ncbi:MAG: MATE family efflux transporter [Alphaproteobacteria bacterium]|nr:MATE family efflux transporter [Alphaproteobacteria bacterium]
MNIQHSNINKQILLTSLSLFVQFSITTVDFIFLEKISYLAAIGVASLIVFVYMIQQIITVFSQSMVSNALYKDASLGEDFKSITSLGFILTLSIAIIMCVIIFFFQGSILSGIKISAEAKQYAVVYMVNMIPFFLAFAIQQYFSYILYSVGLARLNFIYFIVIIILNTVLNIISLYILQLGVAGIAWSSSLSVILVLPVYIYLAHKYNVNIRLHKFQKDTYLKVYLGVKNLGITAIIEPIAQNSVRFILVLIVAYLGQEVISAKRHASNFLTLALTLSLSFGIILQAAISRLYGEYKLEDIKKLYAKYVRIGIIANFLLSAITLGFIYLTLDFYSTSTDVKKYIIICLFMGLFTEPMRLLSLISKAHIRGLQVANTPFIFSFAAKLLLIYPFYYLVIKYTEFGVVGILAVEGISYFANYVVYTFMIKRKYKALSSLKDNTL